MLQRKISFFSKITEKLFRAKVRAYLQKSLQKHIRQVGQNLVKIFPERWKKPKSKPQNLIFSNVKRDVGKRQT